MRGSQAKKLFESVIYNFLTIPKYVILWLQTKKTSFVPWPACWEGFQIGRIYVVHILDIFTFFLSIYLHNFGHWFHFWDKKKLKHSDCCLISERYFGQVLSVILYLARRSACALYLFEWGQNKTNPNVNVNLKAQAR